MSAQTRVLVVDDHPIVVAAIARLLRESPHFSICGEVGDAERALQVATELHPHLIVLDLMLGGRDELGLIKSFHAIDPAIRIAVYSSHDEKIYARRCLAAGAHGYLMKGAEIEQLRRMLEAVARGESFVSEVVQQQLIRDLSNRRRADAKPVDIDTLSERELQVLRLLGLGSASVEIADKLGLTVKSVAAWRRRIKTKLNLANSRDLESYAEKFARDGKPPGVE